MSAPLDLAVAPATVAASDALRRDNRRVFTKLGIVAVLMFGFGYALVPFYDKICEVTGLRNIAQPDALRNTQVVASRSVRIELDSNLRKLPWGFRALESVVDVHPGELRQVMFEIENRSSQPLTGQAIPSYGPRHAAQYFRKLECFCFAPQRLAPGEKRSMPVVFVIDPALPADIPAITLSYTFFEVEGGGRT